MIRPDLEARGYQVFEVSAIAHKGLKELSFALAGIIAKARATKPKEEATRIVIRPKAVDDAGFTVTLDEDGIYRVRGEKPERWVRQTDFNNDEAVGYLADRLNRLGVEDAADEGGRPGRRRCGHRPRGERGRLRLGADRDGRRRDARPPRRGPPPGGAAPGGAAPPGPRLASGTTRSKEYDEFDPF